MKATIRPDRAPAWARRARARDLATILPFARPDGRRPPKVYPPNKDGVPPPPRVRWEGWERGFRSFVAGGEFHWCWTFFEEDLARMPEPLRPRPDEGIELGSDGSGFAAIVTAPTPGEFWCCEHCGAEHAREPVEGPRLRLDRAAPPDRGD